MKRGMRRNDMRQKNRPYVIRFLPAGAAILFNIILWTALISQPFLAGKLPACLKQTGILTVFAKEEAGPASKSGLDMTVKYGYDQYVKYGRYMNVTAEITNNGNKFKGWFQVIVPKSGNNAVYRRQIQIASGLSQKVSISLPLMENISTMQVLLVDGSGNTMIEKKLKLKIGNYEKLSYVGILSDEAISLDYLKNFGTRVFYLSKDTLSDDYRALDLLDILVINHFDTGQLRTKQLEAINKWIQKGGTLVIGTGEYQQETLAGLGGMYSIRTEGTGGKENITFDMTADNLQDLKQDIADYQEERKIFLELIKDRNDMLKAYGNETIPVDTSVFQRWTKERIGQLGIEIIEKDIADVTLKGSSIIISEKGHNIMQTVPVGRGKVELFQIDLSLGLKDKTIGLAVLNEIRKNMSTFKLAQLEEEYYGSYLNYGVFNSISYTNAKDIPRTARYIIILTAYIVIIGPVIFFLLRKLDKRNLTWCVVPLTAALFTLLIYFAGSDTRINEPYAGYVRLLDYQEENKVNEEFYFSLTSPNNQNYSVPFNRSYNITELRGNGDNSFLYNYKKKKNYFDRYITAIEYEKDKTVLQIKDNPAFSPVYYQWDSTYDGKSLLTCNIHYAGDKVYGTVTNGFDFDITNAMLNSDGYIINVGDLRKGETVSIEGKNTAFMTTRAELYNSDIINRIAGGSGNPKENTPQINRIINVIYYLTENNLLDDNQNSSLIGFVNKYPADPESEDNLLGDLSTKMNTYGTTALRLPVKVDYTDGDKVFVPSIDPYVFLSEGYFDNYYQSRYLTNDSMTVKYHLPEEDKVISFEYLLNRNQESSSDYLSAFDGSIYFLNVRTGNYDEVFKEGPGSCVTDAGNYLSHQNTITIKYSTKMSLKGYQMVLPYISYWKEAASDAGN